MKSDFNERRERRIERLRQRAEKKKQNAETTFEQESRLRGIIPLGQPILIGHHSEGKDRRFRNKLDNMMRKGIALEKEGRELERRADAAENNSAIFSDDPEAVRKLKTKIAEKEKTRGKLKNINKMIRAGKWDEVPQVNREALDRQQRYSWTVRKDKKGIERPIYPDYVFQNLGQEIRRLKARLKKIEEMASAVNEEAGIGEIRVLNNVDENRVQIFFPGKPADEIRSKLKRNGFRWARSVGCWQRHYNGNDQIFDLARAIAEEASK